MSLPFTAVFTTVSVNAPEAFTSTKSIFLLIRHRLHGSNYIL